MTVCPGLSQVGPRLLGPMQPGYCVTPYGLFHDALQKGWPTICPQAAWGWASGLSAPAEDAASLGLPRLQPPAALSHSLACHCPYLLLLLDPGSQSQGHVAHTHAQALWRDR